MSEGWHAAADVTKLLLLRKCKVTHILPCRVWRCLI